MTPVETSHWPTPGSNVAKKIWKEVADPHITPGSKMTISGSGETSTTVNGASPVQPSASVTVSV